MLDCYLTPVLNVEFTNCEEEMTCGRYEQSQIKYFLWEQAVPRK